MNVELIKPKLIPILECDLLDRYDETLDEVYGIVKICGYEYQASQAFLDVDPTAYRCGFNDWLDSECQNEVYTEVDGEYYDTNEIDDLIESED